MQRRKLHIGRWLCNAAAVAALLFAAAAVALWVRSHWASDSVYAASGSVSAMVMTAPDGCLFHWTGGGSERDRPLRMRRFSNPPADLILGRLDGNWRFWTGSKPRRLLGVITWGRANYGASEWGMSVLLPWWLLGCAAVAAAPGLFMISRRLRRRARRRAGQCVRCGYDLCATPDHCPECGALPQPPYNPPMQRTAIAATGAVR
jgi:hypothetical protein